MNCACICTRTLVVVRPREYETGPLCTLQEMNPFTLSLDPSSRAKGTARPSPAASPLPILFPVVVATSGEGRRVANTTVWGSRLLQAHHGVAPGFARCALDGSPFFAVVDDSGDARQRRRRSGCQRRSPCRLPQYFQCEAARVERDNGAASFWLLLCDDYGVVLTTPRAPSKPCCDYTAGLVARGGVAVCSPHSPGASLAGTCTSNSST